MRRGMVRSTVGWIIIVGHLLILLYIFTIKNGTWDIGRQMSAALTVTPVFSAYFVAVVRTFINLGEEFDSGPRVNKNFVAVCLLLPICLIFGVAFAVYKFPTDGFAEPDQLQKVLAGLETLLGGTVGLVIGNLFPSNSSKDSKQ